MCETSFNGVKITWDQMGYLQSVLSPQQFIAFLQMKKAEPQETTRTDNNNINVYPNPVSVPTEPQIKPTNTGLFGNNPSRPQTAGLFGNNPSRPQSAGLFGRPSK